MSSLSRGLSVAKFPFPEVWMPVPLYPVLDESSVSQAQSCTTTIPYFYTKVLHLTWRLYYTCYCVWITIHVLRLSLDYAECPETVLYALYHGVDLEDSKWIQQVGEKRVKYVSIITT